MQAHAARGVSREVVGVVERGGVIFLSLCTIRGVEREGSIRRTGYRPGEGGDVTAYLKCMAGVRPHNPHRCSSARSDVEVSRL